MPNAHVDADCQPLFFGEARSNPQKSSQSRISSPIRNWVGSPFFSQATRASVRSLFPGFSIQIFSPISQNQLVATQAPCLLTSTVFVNSCTPEESVSR